MILMELIVLSNVKKKPAVSPARKVKKDVAANRIVAFSIALAAVILALMALTNSTISTRLTFYNYVLPILIPLSALAAAGFTALWINRRKRGLDESGSGFPSSLLAVISAGAFFASVGYTFMSGTRLLVSLLALAALYYIYFLYSRSFFAYSAVTVIGGLLLSFFRFGAGLLGLILPLALLLVLETVLMLMLLGGKGSLGRMIPANRQERLPFMLTAAILLAGIVLGLAAPSMLFYAIALLFALFLVVAIINTLRMM